MLSRVRVLATGPMLLMVLGTGGIASHDVHAALRRSVIANGGTRSTGPNLVSHGTVGQPLVGVSTGANLSLSQGFWTNPGSPLVDVMSLDLAPDAFNLRSRGLWVTATLEPDPPASPADIDVASIRLNGSVAVDASAPVSIDDADGDGRPDLTIKFDRAAVQLVVEEGDAVVVTVTGNTSAGYFAATDVIRVVRAHVTAPLAGSTHAAGSALEVRWETPAGVNVESVAVLFSADDGAHWDLVAHELPNSGSYLWTPPDAATDQGRVAIVLVRSVDGSGYQVEGVLGMSGRFGIASTVGVTPPKATLSLEGATANPTRGLRVRFSLPSADPAMLAVFDLAGRQVAARQVGSLGPGQHDVSFEGTGLASGVYLLRLVQGDRRLVARAVVVR